ncbi:MAG: DUF4258 domain-containing protein [Anaerolineaceae bacterium]|nr:DUF4258 domain-containing protein [Anaerolineaceae bacterium]
MSGKVRRQISGELKLSDRIYIYARHAVFRMAERNFDRAMVESVVKAGETIREYTDDRPFPSRLILGWVDNRPLHIVAADNDAANETIIITVYEPDPNIWNDDFRSKRT